MPIENEHIDRTALRRAICTLEVEIRAAKQRLRTRWVEPMSAVQRRHERLRHEVTAHLVLLAASRGRLHTRHRSEAWLHAHVAPLLERHALACSEPLWRRIVGGHQDVVG